MADYPESAARVEELFKKAVAQNKPRRAKATKADLMADFQATDDGQPNSTPTLQQAAEKLAAAALESYTTVADSCLLSTVKVWKSFDDRNTPWAPAFDADFRVTLAVKRNGQPTNFSTDVKIIIQDEPGSKEQWRLELYDWSVSRGPVQVVRGKIVQDGGNTVFEPTAPPRWEEKTVPNRESRGARDWG